MSKIISKEQIKEALDKSIEGVLETPGYMEKFAREIEKAVIKSVYETASYAVISDLRNELERADEKIASLEMDARYCGLIIDKNGYPNNFLNITKKTFNVVV